MPARKYFGTDGIRGEVGRAPITPDFVLRLGWALGKAVARGAAGRARVIIGKDTRVSGYMLESALEAGLSAAGVDISLIGPMPTPGIAYLTRTSRASAGIVISASHNPYYDNGIKFFSPDGMKLDEETEQQIEQLLECELESVGSADLGKAERFSDAAGRYIEFCKHSVPDRFSLRGLKVAVDCANGATYQILPRVLYELGADLEVIGDEPDGFNINEQCGSTSVAELVDLVRGSSADVGIAVDGDGDRVVMVDGGGRLVDGDGILFVIADHLLERGEFPGGVVGTLMTNLGLEKMFGEMGIPFERTRVGDRYVLARLLDKGWKLGGETSGHILCLDKHSTGDGIIAALQVLLAMVDRGQPLEQLTSKLTIFPQKLVNVRLDANGRIDPAQVIDARPVKDAVARAQATLGDSGRIVLRPSGTEPLLRVMVEGRDEQQVSTLSREIADAVSAAL